MAIMAIKTAAYRNAVSRLHRTVSQQMWEGLWPSIPVWEVPITSVCGQCPRAVRVSHRSPLAS